MQFSSLLLVAMTAATSFALPAQQANGNALEKRIDEGAQSCTAEDHGSYATWSVNIGAPFSSDVCHVIYNAIKDGNTSHLAPTNWQCVDIEGHYQLWFDFAKTFQGASHIINPALEHVFPHTGGLYGNINGFNCPDWGLLLSFSPSSTNTLTDNNPRLDRSSGHFPFIVAMQSERYEFDCPDKVGWLMADLVSLYLSYAFDSFPFEWLQRTKDLEMRCENVTEEKVIFPISPELLNAIHKCERVTEPEKRRGIPSDWGFSGFMKTAVHEVLDEVPFTEAQEFHGPLFDRLNMVMIKSYPRILGVHIFHLHHNHWSCMIRDHSSAFDPKQQEDDHRDYLLRSEILAATSIFWRQMHETVWLPEKNRYNAKLIYKEGLLMATVVTFICAKVRIVQATLNPSERYPTLTFTLKAIYNLGKDNYDKEIAFDVLKWILSPPRPAKEVAVR
ncbi:hypothetical protein FQN54_009074 [Arachnomyces sp. PD_36]|nr:hypothetical protein FQN54_009074 [Arachnomyces sp. PD_36]